MLFFVYHLLIFFIRLYIHILYILQFIFNTGIDKHKNEQGQPRIDKELIKTLSTNMLEKTPIIFVIVTKSADIDNIGK
jgi:hypothetical protein